MVFSYLAKKCSCWMLKCHSEVERCNMKCHEFILIILLHTCFKFCHNEHWKNFHQGHGFSQCRGIKTSEARNGNNTATKSCIEKQTLPQFDQRFLSFSLFIQLFDKGKQELWVQHNLEWSSTMVIWMYKLHGYTTEPIEDQQSCPLNNPS